MPAISTTRRSCISPQRPRTAGVRSARDNAFVVDPSAATCSVSRAYAGHAVVFGLGQTCVHSFERVGDGLLEARERRLGKIEKRRAIVLERFGRQRLEGVAQTHVCRVEQRLRGLDRLLLTRNLFSQPLVVLFGRSQLRSHFGTSFSELSACARSRQDGRDDRTDHRRHRGEKPFHSS